MIVGLDVAPQIVEHVVGFVTKPVDTSRSKVLYHATIQMLFSQDFAVSKLIIPSSLVDCDYNFEKLIEHIRIDKKENVARIPIIVFSENEDECRTLFDKPRNFEESRYKKIAVTFTSNPKVDNFVLAFDKKALKTYLNQIRNLPYNKGSHDKTNAWGSFVVLRSLMYVDVVENQTLSPKLDEVQNNLLEETYYKRLIQSFDRTEVIKKSKNQLNSARLNLKKNLGSGRILIIEDQLKDGWKSAYESIFSVSVNSELYFMKKEDDAREFVQKTPDIDLILLDVRLASDRNKNKPVEELSGVKLAKWIRDELPTVPIIAATASNKSWTLEALLERGINSYWVKGSPDLINSIDLGVENVIDFYKKINTTLEWSQRTGYWQEELYRIARIVGEQEPQPRIGKRLHSKAKSLQALLFRSFSPFSKELSEGLQMNLAFLEIYSCMNDLIEWVCDICNNDDNETSTWCLQGDEIDIPLVERRKKLNTGKVKIEYEWVLQDQRDYPGSSFFPDTKVAKEVLEKKRLKGRYKFKELSNIRNGLPLIHGKLESLASTSETIERVTDENIDSLVALLTSLVNHHTEYLKRQKEEKHISSK